MATVSPPMNPITTATGTDLSDRQAHRLLAAIIGLFTLAFSLLGYLQYATFTHVTGDSAQYGYAFCQTIQGGFFPYFAEEGSCFGSHPNFILYLGVPLFFFAPTMYSVFLFQSLMVCLAAWPTYLLARDLTHDRVASIVAALGLLVFAPVAVHINQVHDDQFGLVFVLFAVLFFEKRAFGWFAVFLILGTLAKETIAFNTAFFGVYALVRRRSWRWVLLPLGWSLAYFWIMTTFVMPRWGGFGQRLYTTAAYFSDFGATRREVLVTLLSRPSLVLQTILAPDRLWYLARLLAPLLVILPFASWIWLAAVPTLLINLLSSNSILRLPDWHYGIISGGLLWLSFIASLPFWARRCGRWLPPHSAMRSICLLTLLVAATQAGDWLHPSRYRQSPATPALRAAIDLVPVDATVLCPDNLLAHFFRHPAIHSVGGLAYHQRDLNQAFDYDYIVFDLNFQAEDADFQRAFLEFIAGHRDYEKISDRDGVFVFKRTGTPPRILRWAS